MNFPTNKVTKRCSRRRRIDRCTCLPFATRCVHPTVRVFPLNTNPGVECAFPPAVSSPVRHWHWLGHSPCLIDPQDCKGTMVSAYLFLWQICVCMSVVAEFSLWPGRYDTFRSDLQAVHCCFSFPCRSNEENLAA